MSLLIENAANNKIFDVYALSVTLLFVVFNTNYYFLIDSAIIECERSNNQIHPPSNKHSQKLK